MKDTQSAKVGRIGESAIGYAVAKMGWIYRDQGKNDFGIDGQIEMTEGNEIIPRLVAVQVKASASDFSEPTVDGWWYRPKDEHVQYWLNHSLPVIVVLHSTQTELSYWQSISKATLEEAKAGGWKVRVPRAQVLNDGARAPLRILGDGDPYVLRVRDLQLAKPWMEMLLQGKRLVIDIEEWINKTSGRGTLQLGIDEEDGEEPTPLAQWGVFLGLTSYAEVIPRLFAWADIHVHEETYEEANQMAYEDECVRYDEGDRIASVGYADWDEGRGLPALRPYANGAGEVDLWRLELSLNQLGKAFMVVDDFATSGSKQLT